MATGPLPMLLIPGAWMGAWIWEETAERLGRAGFPAHTLTLSGLESEAAETRLAEVRLDDHVADALWEAHEIGEPLMVVGHSYSGLVAGMVADRAPELVVHTTILAGFFPRDGRSLLDDWGSDAEERAAERAQIERAEMSWAPPPAEGIVADPGLDAEQARWLGHQLQPHPGRTVLDKVTVTRPLSTQPVTVIANVGDGDPRSTLPADLADDDLSDWTFRSISEGHWPMLSCPNELDAVLIETATRAGARLDSAYHQSKYR